MKNIILSLFLILLVSCKKDTTFYGSNIAFANKTGYDLKIQLFPKSQFLMGTELYKMGNTGGGYTEKNFKLLKVDSTWWARRNLYFSDDTVIKPMNLIDEVFDSIKIFVQNEDSTVIKFSKDNSFHYSINPYNIDSVWNRNKLLNSMFDMGWNGFQYVYVFFINKKYFEK